MATTDYEVTPGGALTGLLRVPGDKSISHRSVIFSALATGRSTISGLLEGEDVLGTVAAFRALGVPIVGPHGGRLEIDGVGLAGLRAPAAPLDFGNSGTAMRLMAGLLSAQPFSSELIGDASLMSRPMARVTLPLQRMGARIEATGADGRPPLKIRPAERLIGQRYEMPVASAQVKSAILLAGLYAEGETIVVEPAPSRDHTERMLAGFGYPVHREGSQITVRGRAGTLTGGSLEVPADLSSAAFFLVAGSITPHSRLTLTRVGMNPTRTGVIDVLRAMGASITTRNDTVVNGEPVADLIVEARPLRGLVIDPKWVPLAIDEFPALFVAAACAEGTTVVRGAHELRVKESDRLGVMAKNLSTLGVRVTEYEDGLAVTGGTLRGGTVDSRGDHRIAMAFAVAGHNAQGPVRVRDCQNVATSFPGFDRLAREAGMAIGVLPA